MIAFPDTQYGNSDYLQGQYGWQIDVQPGLVDSDSHCGSPFASMEEALVVIAMRFSGVWCVNEHGQLV